MPTRISAAYGDLKKSKRYVRGAKSRGLMGDEIEGLLTAFKNADDVAALLAYVRAQGVRVKTWAQVRAERQGVDV